MKIGLESKKSIGIENGGDDIMEKSRNISIMSQRNKAFVLSIMLGAAVFGCASNSGGDYRTNENSGQRITFVLEAAPTDSISQFEFLGEGDITFINTDNRNPFKMEGSFKGGWNIFDSGKTHFYGVCDPDGRENSGDELSFTACFYDSDSDGKEDMINMRIHTLQTGICLFDCCQTLQGNNIRVNISEV